MPSIVITGASSGIGAALAEDYAAQGVVLGLIGRDRERLDASAAACRARGADVECGNLDIRDREALHAWLTAFDEAHPVDLLIANAGVSTGLEPGRSRESDAEADRLADINYKGTVNTVSGLVEAMRARRQGHIAVISSLAGLKALPDMPSYSATKAALVAYGHSIRGWLRPFGVTVSIVCPGFVTSPMSSRHKGARPFEVSIDDAVRTIRRGLDRRRPMIAFPRILALGIWLDRLLPTRIQDWIIRLFQADIDPDHEARKSR